MTVFANPLMGGADSSLASVLAALEPHGDKALVFEYDGGEVQAGYHVTEVKAGSFVTLDCGGNPDAWQETPLTAGVWVPPARAGKTPLYTRRSWPVS
eukprot:gene45898-61347_t